MLTYYFDNHSLPMYEQLYRFIKMDILNRKLLPHEKLPSKRNLSKHLKISLITVENAYHQLSIEGYIYSIEKKGYYVSEIDNVQTNETIEISIQPPQYHQYLIDLKSNTILPQNFPFSSWAKLTRQILSMQDASLLSRTPPMGCFELQEAIQEHLYSFSGIHVSPHQIVIGAGTEYLYNLVIWLLGRNSVYALEDPGHQSISQVYNINGISYCYISLDKNGINIDELYHSNANVAHISPAHHYPTGITMPIKRRLEILNWANLKNAYIIEDDYDSELRLQGKPIPSLFQSDHNERVIYMNTFSKTLAPSFRISYMVLPAHLVSVFYDKVGFYTCTVSRLEQMILAQFIKQGYFEKHINRMRNYYKSLRNEFLSQLEKSPLALSVTIKEENAGLHFLMTYQSFYSDQDIIKKAHSIGLNISTLSQYYHNPFDTHTLVVNYSGLSFNNITLAISLLENLLL